MRGIKTRLAMAALAAAILPTVASAQRAPEWQWEASIYGYFPSIGGTTKFPPPASGGSSVDVSVNQIIDSLKFTFMGTLGAQSATWGGFTDIIYLDVGGDKSGTRDITLGGGLPAGATASGSLDLKSTLWTFAGTYRISRDPASTAEVFAGARLADIKQSLNWQFTGTVDTIPVGSRSGYQSASLKNWDGIVGIKGRASFGEGNRWFVPWYVDVGTGDSDLTWQGIIGLGYKYSWGDIFAVWRYIDYKMPSDKVVQDLTLNGGAVGVSFRW